MARRDTPREIDAALSAILSKLRSALRRLSIRLQTPSTCVGDRPDATAGCRVIDVEHAANSIDEAEGAVPIRRRNRGDIFGDSESGAVTFHLLVSEIALCWVALTVHAQSSLRAADAVHVTVERVYRRASTRVTNRRSQTLSLR